MEESLMVEAFNEVNLLASWILRQRKNPLRNGIVLSSKPKQGKEENAPAETKLVARPLEIKPTSGSTIPSDGLRTIDLKKKNPVVHKGKNQPEKRSKEIQPVIDWKENRDCLSGPLEKLLLWCNEFEEEQLKTIVKETEEIRSAMTELFLKIAERLIDILDYDSAPESVKKSVTNVQSLKEKYDDESSTGESPQPQTYFDEPKDLMESLRTNVSHLYELGPTITALLVDSRDRERPPKRTKSSPVAQISLDQSDPTTALQTSLPQRHLNPDTAKSSPLPPTTYVHYHRGLEGPSPTLLRSARTPQGSAIPFKTVPPVQEQTSRQPSSEFKRGWILPVPLARQTKTYTELISESNKIPDLDAEIIPTKQSFWYKVERLKVSQSLRMESGRQVSVRFSSKPFDKRAVEKIIKETLSGAQGSNTVSILCDVWYAKLESRDNALPAELVTQFVAPHWPEVARQLVPQRLEALDTDRLLDIMESIHNILKILWNSTLYNAKDNEGITKALLLLVYISLCEILCEASNIVWDRIRSSDKSFRDPHATEWQQIYLESIDGWLHHNKYVPEYLRTEVPGYLRTEVQQHLESRRIALKPHALSVTSQTPPNHSQFAKMNTKQKDSSKPSFSDSKGPKASFQNQPSYLLFLVGIEQERYNKMGFDRKKVGDFLNKPG